MVAKHTPGPWCYEPSKDNYGDAALSDHECAGSIMAGPKGWHIARVWRFADEEAETSANGKLLAAAPELLEALIELLRLYRHETALQNGDNVVTVKAHNAIAKATGAA